MAIKPVQILSISGPIFHENLLRWYDANARVLPWRIPPDRSQGGELPDPYHIWLSEIMLQQTTVATVEAYFRRFTEVWPDVFALANAKDADVMAAWAGLGYYARARNMLKAAREVAHNLGGVFPQDRLTLEKLPGVGPYTSAAIAAIAFGCRETVVDGNVDRVMSRLYALSQPIRDAKPQIREKASALTPDQRPGDYAQAVMDLGATVCRPRAPLCAACPVSGFCLARKKGVENELPVKAPKVAKPTRKGTIYLVQRTDGAMLLERRPDKGLLGGMLGWPGTDWREGSTPEPTPPVAAQWSKLAGQVRHTFTHFHLILDVEYCRVDANAKADRGDFVAKAKFRPADLPTVMRKAYDLASTTLRGD